MAALQAPPYIRPRPSLRGAIARQHRRAGGLLRMQVLAIHPLSYEMAILMPHEHLRPTPRITILFGKRDGAADRLCLAGIGLGKSPSALDDFPPRFLADDNIS
jgi:hypothetical protein